MEYLLALLMGAIIPTLLWYFKPDGLRRFLGSEPKKPYRMISEDFDKDHVIKEVKNGLEPHQRLILIIRYMVPQYEGRGYKIVKLKDGRECSFTGKVSDGSVQEQVLMMGRV